MKCTPDRMKYLNQKVKKIYQTCMKNRNTDELKEFKSTKFFKFLNETVAQSNRKTTSSEETKNKKLAKMCMKLVNQQQQNIQNINSISEENEILREQLNRRNATIAENETDILNKQLELSNLKSTKKRTKH